MRFGLVKALFGLSLVASTAASCGDVPVRVAPDPVGVLKGSILYAGPLPCTEKGRILGNAVVLLFNKLLLPPPEGLAARSYRIGVVPGEVLFQGYEKRLYVNPDGSRWCPDPTRPENQIAATAPFEIGIIEAGTYQARGFFDLDGDFDAVFRFSNLPTLGDVVGGSVSNATAVLAGKPPVYQEYTFGRPNAAGQLVIPPEGQVIGGVSVAFARQTVLQRPYFHVSQVQGPKASEKAEAPPPEVMDEAKPVAKIAADLQIIDAGPTAVQDYLPVIRVSAGVRDAERDAALKSPFFMHVDRPGKLLTYWYDANRDGVVDEQDHVIGTLPALVVRSMAPIISLAKLGPSDLDPDGAAYNARWNPTEDPRFDRFDPIRRTSQINPRVIASAVVLGKDGNSNSTAHLLGANDAKKTPVPVDFVDAMLRPSSICIPGKKIGGVRVTSDPSGETTVITPFEKDLAGANIIDANGTLDDIAAQLKRNRAEAQVVYACLVPGFYSMNLIYPDTGQAWTLPNETGVCMPGEASGKAADGRPLCAARPKLASQSFVVQITPESVPGKCNEIMSALKAQNRPAYDRYRETCLRPDEQEKLDKGSLWSK